MAHQIKANNTSELNRRRHALAWKRLYAQDKCLVQDGFELLGYDTIENYCKLSGGLQGYADPSEQQKIYILILENVVSQIFTEFLRIEQFPKCYIMKDYQPSFDGKASVVKRKEIIYNDAGLPIRYFLKYVVLEQTLLHKGYFNKALSTYIHELCHVFGGDCSTIFSRALTYAIDFILRQASIIALVEKEWDKIE